MPWQCLEQCCCHSLCDVLECKAVFAAQVIFALPPQGDVDYTMRIYNSDGSEPEMCGNGIRCLARFVAEKDKAGPRQYKVQTGAGGHSLRHLPLLAAAKSYQHVHGAFCICECIWSFWRACMQA